MELETNGSESRRSSSISQTSSAGSSLRRRSFSFTNPVNPQNDDDVESVSAAEAGDIGDRALNCNRYSESGRLRLSVDNVMESGSFVPIPEDGLTHIASPVSPTTMEIISPRSIDATIHADDKRQEHEKKLPWLLDYISCLVHLAVFGILGVLTRYLLQKLFGPGAIGATGDENYMYLDLPSNMLGSFLMGWFGIVFKEDISRVSDYLVIGLTTGYLGSLTTFSGWNQKMLDLSVQGKWVFVVLGFLIGFLLATVSIDFGVETAESCRGIWKKLNASPSCDHWSSKISNWKMDNLRRQFALMVLLLLMLGCLWCVCVALEEREFHSGGSVAQLLLACIVGPLGVWIRWFLSRLNGHGLGKSGLFKWIPFGTLIANVSAACVMAALATLKKAVKTQTCDTVANGIQFGLLGCLSTVSTFEAEVHKMRKSNRPMRAYGYALITILMSFGFGTLIYSVPVWLEGYD